MSRVMVCVVRGNLSAGHGHTTATAARPVIDTLTSQQQQHSNPLTDNTAHLCNINLNEASVNSLYSCKLVLL